MSSQRNTPNTVLPVVLDPKNTRQDPADFERKGRDLAGLFRKNFRRFVDGVSEAVWDAGP